VNVAIHIDSRFVLRLTRAEIGNGEKPDIPPLIALANGLNLGQPRMVLDKPVENVG